MIIITVPMFFACCGYCFKGIQYWEFGDKRDEKDWRGWNFGWIGHGFGTCALVPIILGSLVILSKLREIQAYLDTGRKYLTEDLTQINSCFGELNRVNVDDQVAFLDKLQIDLSEVASKTKAMIIVAVVLPVAVLFIMYAIYRYETRGTREEVKETLTLEERYMREEQQKD